MKPENRMKPHYAVSKVGRLLNIKEAHDSEEECFCLYCGCRMLKKCGSIRTWHFAHDYRYENEVKKKCSYESYLHEFAKKRLKQWFEEAYTINLYYRQQAGCQYANSCRWKEAHDTCSKYEEKVINLKDFLTECRLEETVLVGNERFRADLLWFNPENMRNRIMVEVEVTHECTPKKKQSNARIIEFEVHSEEDVERIVSNDIRESDTVRFYGFNCPYFSIDDMPAKHILNKFIYYHSGKAYPKVQSDCKTYMKRHKGALFEMTVKEEKLCIGSSYKAEINGSRNPLTIGRFHNWGLSLAKIAGNDVRSCYLCKHHKYDFDNNVLSCELTESKTCEAKEAQDCCDYDIDRDVVHKNFKEIMQYSSHNKVDIWGLGTAY